MHDAALVGSDQALDDLQTIVGGLPQREWSCIESLAEGFAFEQFRYDVMQTSVEANVIDSNDVGMIESRGRAGLLLKAANMIWIPAGCRTDQLQGYVALQPFVARAKNLAHAAGANLFQDLVMSHPLPGHK